MEQAERTSENLNIDKYLHWVVTQAKACSWGRRLGMVQDTCLGRKRSWVQIPAGPTNAHVKKYHFFPSFYSPNFKSTKLNIQQSTSSNIFLCMDCVFWCGRCSEPTLKGKKSINQLASSCACSKFQPRGGSR